MVYYRTVIAPIEYIIKLSCLSDQSLEQKAQASRYTKDDNSVAFVVISLVKGRKKYEKNIANSE